MITDEIFAQLGINSNTEIQSSASSSYNRVVELASMAFTSDRFSDYEKQNLYLELCDLYNQCDKKD